MNKAPKMISSKDLYYICDMINCNLISAKKVNHYMEETEDEDIKEEFEKVIETFRDQYHFLVNLLK
jgi:outer membrane protein W